VPFEIVVTTESLVEPPERTFNTVAVTVPEAA